MRICLLRHPGSIHMRRWIGYFAAQGHEVHVIYFEGDLGSGPEPEKEFPDLCGLANVSIHCVRDELALSEGKTRWGVLVERLRWKAGAMLLVACHAGLYLEDRLGKRSMRKLDARTGVANTRRMLGQLRGLKKTIRQINPDILHAHTAYWYGYMGALSGFHPFVVSGWGTDVLLKPNTSVSARNRVKHALEHADAVTAQTRHLCGHLKTEFRLEEQKVLRMPWGIDVGVFHRGYEAEARELRRSLAIEAESPVILSNRSMAPQYFIESIVDAAPQVISRCPNAVFVFLRGYGTEEYESEMRLRVEKSGAMGNTRFVPTAVGSREMATYLNMSLAVVSMHGADQFAMSVSEAMACGAIPVVGNIDVYREYLQDGENALFFDPESARELAEKLVSCITHPDLKERFYNLNKEIVHEHENWHTNAPQMVNLYRRFVPGGSQKEVMQ